MESIENKRLIRLSKSCISDAEKEAVMGVLDREYLGMGTEVQQFEQKLSNFFGRDAVCVVNGTAALHLALQACGVGRGDEVLIPSLTYVASFQAISATGAIPVACDINPETLLLDLSDAEKRISHKTKALMPVHYSGGVGDLDGVYLFAKKHKLRIVEDAAHAFGTTYKEKKVGSFGDIACFSFDGIKNITSGEGGCVVTDDKDILKKISDARLLGVEKDTDKRFSGQRSWEFNVKNQGWRYHMSNIMAAIGIQQLNKFPVFADKRQQLAKKYDQIFYGNPTIHPVCRDYDNVVPHIYVIRILGMKNRPNIQKELERNGIQVGYHYHPNHLLQLYRRQNTNPLPVTDSVCPEIISLPLHPDMIEEDVEYIASVIIKLLSHNGRN